MYHLLFVLLVLVAGCGGGKKVATQAPANTPAQVAVPANTTPTPLTLPTALLTVSPSQANQYHSGDPIRVAINWTTQNATHTRGVNFDTGGVTSGSVTHTITGTRTYTLYASNAGGTVSRSATARVVQVWNPR